MPYRIPSPPDPEPRPKRRLKIWPEFYTVMLALQFIILFTCALGYFANGGLDAVVHGLWVLAAIGVQVVIVWYYRRLAMRQAEREAEYAREAERRSRENPPTG